MTNSFETNEKVQNLSKRQKVIKKNKVEIIELKDKIAKIKNSLDELNGRARDDRG